MITDKYMNEMREMIEHLCTRLEETEGNEQRLYQIMLEATMNSYEAKLKLKMQDDNQATP
jgi:hypothetical protein